MTGRSLITSVGFTSRILIANRLPARCPSRSLFSWRIAQWIVTSGTRRFITACSVVPTIEITCRLTAFASFSPAKPMSRDDTRSAAAMRLTASNVVRLTFWISA
jgi:hypothetical protein